MLLKPAQLRKADSTRHILEQINAESQILRIMCIGADREVSAAEIVIPADDCKIGINIGLRLAQSGAVELDCLVLCNDGSEDLVDQRAVRCQIIGSGR